ncbi:MAG TPA: ATP-binding protein, partial [Candidatus Thermoplasmatota archaeon]|nr:ATP-binding protein [Candidatus Thermoplasmatota archaeon]
LVSGVAHELRTPLTFLATNAFLAQQRIQRVARNGGSAQQALEAAQPFFQEVTAAVDRINLLVEDLRKYTRARGQDTVAAEQLEEVVDEAVQLFRATNRSTHVVLSTYEATPPTPMRRGPVQQLVLNLLQNAAEASPTGAAIRVAVRPTDGGPELEVADEGTGMPPELIERMYEPLFTTKERGTGLGLTIVRRIADAHGAGIACESAPGRGTTFRVRFPAGAL